MSLESRISEALHANDNYEPSVDLFARLHRSIEENIAHRRRVRLGLSAVILLLLSLATLLASVAVTTESGTIALPKWSIGFASGVVLMALLLGVGPVLRRYGRPLLDDVFHLSPETGVRFSRLLDIAYYLFFGGTIVGSIDPTFPSRLIRLTGDRVWEQLASVAGFMAQLGLVHVLNLAVLPLIGLLFTSSVRRARRRDAGPDAPPESELARKADRVASGIVFTIAAVTIAGVLLLIGFVLLANNIP